MLILRVWGGAHFLSGDTGDGHILKSTWVAHLCSLQAEQTKTFEEELLVKYVHQSLLKGLS